MTTIGLHNFVPVGTIFSSMLSESDFTGSTNSDWVLCDGRDVTGSEYETVTGSNVIPDARGQFLRGKNNGRTGYFADSDGERDLGNEQSGTTALPLTSFTTDDPGDHNHGQTGTYTTNSNHTHSPGSGASEGPVPNEGVSTAMGDTTTGGSHTHTIGGGDSETRPCNLCVNYFIKINNNHTLFTVN